MNIHLLFRVGAFILAMGGALNTGAASYAWGEITSDQKLGAIIMSLVPFAMALGFWLVSNH